MPMNPEYKKEWLEALRSGQYVQTKETLRRIDEDSTEPAFCCLGVLCDIYLKKNKLSWDTPYSKELPLVRPIREYDYIPEEFVDVLGISIRGKIASRKINGEYVTCLAELNDEANYTFEQIADIIEKEL